MNNTPLKYDVVIVGGGMVGSSLACALANSALSVALVEAYQAPSSWPEGSYDPRVSAITRGSQTFLESLGVWQHILNERASAYEEMRVWDGAGDGSIHFDCAHIGEANLGHIIENRVINKTLMNRAKELDNLTLYCPAKPVQFSAAKNQPADLASLQLDNGMTLQTALLVGADGGQSWLRQQAGILVDVQDYQQNAVVATIHTELSHQNTAWQRFLSAGPLAFLPLSNNSQNEHISSIVWSTSTQQAEYLCALTEKDFLRELENALGKPLGKMLRSDTRAHFPIKAQHAQQYVKPRLALIGDAAHTIHPLAGQGVNLGFADARSLAQVISNAEHKKQDIGSLRTLRRYERSRRGDNALMLETMTLFKTLFSNNSPGLTQLRNAGLRLSNQSQLFKNLIMGKALGH
jgi:2-polyprenylphenol 6-hydroxylase